MKKLLPVGLLVLLAVIGVIIWKSNSTPPSVVNTPPESAIKMVDLSTQPEWVQKLKINGVKGVAANGLSNVTITVEGFPKDVVSSLTYVVQYQTSNKGTQGALSTKPIKIEGSKWVKALELGTCSTKSCVRYEGVTSLEMEIDFTTSAGDSPIWTGVINF